MKRMFLASSIEHSGTAVAKDVEKAAGKNIKKLKTVFINTAAEDSIHKDKSWVDDDRNGMLKGGFNLFDYTITDKSVSQIADDLKDCDVIHINGGNSFYLLYQIKNTGFDNWLKDEIQNGNKIYTSSSAGGVVMSPNIEVILLPEYQEYAKKLPNFNGLNLVDFLIFPHWGSDNFKNIYLDHRIKLAYKPENKIILLNNWQYVEVIDDMYRIKEIDQKASI